MVQVLEKEYEGKVHVKIYRAGKDFDYIPKYGAVTKSMLVINEKKAVTKLTKPAVRDAFKEALSHASGFWKFYTQDSEFFMEYAEQFVGVDDIQFYRCRSAA